MMNVQSKTFSEVPPLQVPVDGMTCASCVRRVEKAAAGVEGVAASAVNFATETLSVTPGQGFSAAALMRAIADAGYEARAEKLVLEVEDMTCASCVSRVEKALLSVPAVETASVNLATGEAIVTVLGGALALADMQAAVDKAGYRLRPVVPQATGWPAVNASDTSGGRDGARHRPLADAGVGGQPDDSREARRAREIALLTRDVWIALVLSLPLFVMEMGSHLYPPLHHTLMQVFPGNTLYYLQFVLATLVLFGPGRRFFVKGVPALIRLAPDMNALVAIGTGAAYLYSLVTTFAPGLLPAEARHVYYEAATVIVRRRSCSRPAPRAGRGRRSANWPVCRRKLRGSSATAAPSISTLPKSWSAIRW